MNPFSGFPHFMKSLAHKKLIFIIRTQIQFIVVEYTHTLKQAPWSTSHPLMQNQNISAKRIFVYCI